MTLSPDGKPLPEEEAARWLDRSLEHWNKHEFGFWHLRTRGDNKFVGRAGLKSDRVLERDEVELAYALLPEYWHQGLATEIGEAILSVGFHEIGLTEVICYTLATNRASQRVMQKLGFRFERDGMHVGLPHVYYRITAAQFAARFAGGA